MERQKITTCLWFENRSEEAVRFYLSVFGGDARILEETRYTEAGPGEPGAMLTQTFEIAGQQFIALNGGPHETFNDAVSLSVDCADQAEVDRLWAALSEGGEERECGWLKDRYGVSWQIAPRELSDMVADPDPAAVDRVMRAMFTMKKLDLQALRDAYAGR
ncbi:VOC family protein [Streptomyces sp. NPDC059853]|uniref:VOC family protein n=1 Tax=Streptomyces sp. NPDC059853 TaxID=3346973 RepID=UPI00365157EA